MEKPYAIHNMKERPTEHSTRECSFFSRLAADNKKSTTNYDDENCPPNKGKGRKHYPKKVGFLMIFHGSESKRAKKLAFHEVNAQVSAVP